MRQTRPGPQGPGPELRRELEEAPRPGWFKLASRRRMTRRPSLQRLPARGLKAAEASQGPPSREPLAVASFASRPWRLRRPSAAANNVVYSVSLQEADSESVG